MSNHLEQLQDYLKKMNRYSHVATLLNWDMETIMPKGGYEQHADAITYFSTELFRFSTADSLGTLLDALSAPEEYAQLDAKWQFVIKRMKRDYDRNKRLPAEVYERYVREQADANHAWKDAKCASDYSIFAPHLEKIIELTKERYSYTNPDEDIYQAMLNDYEEGMDVATIDRLFEELKKELIPFIKEILDAPQPDDTKFHRLVDADTQRKVQHMLLSYIGFSWEKGAVGETEHPFTLNFSSKDVRVTNHYDEDNMISAMFTAIHEGGHAIFEQNVNPDYDGTVAASCYYMGIHESQSRFYENILGRNRNFWAPIYEKLVSLVPQLGDVSLDEFYREINHIRSSCIRCDADEVTYCFHIILRYELEKAIFYDHVPVSELPKLWNEKMQEYLGITPQNDAEGILQDMHWSDGSFGYFPTYLLGSIYDGMYLEAIEADLGSVDEILADGRILDITHWLNRQIHHYGNTRLPKEVIANVCGKELSAEPLIRYFKKKYSEVYKR